MTGTVLDGNIDVAMLRTDGEKIEEFGPYALAPYPPGITEMLRQAQQEALAWNFDGPEPAIFAAAEEALTRAQSAAVRALVEDSGMAMADIGVVGFHGQTVLHRPPTAGRTGDTRQLGDGALMHELLGATVVWDFRTADIRAGGQGAPLAAAYHAALLGASGGDGNTAILNLGGVGNISWWNGAADIVAFDTGPANAPINDFVRARGLGEMDRDGALAASGTVDEERLARLLDHPYLVAPYPKSLDRFSFTAAMADGLSDADGAATLTAFTAAAVGKALDLLPVRPTRLFVSGGGRHNPTLMAMIEHRASVTAVSADTIGWRGDAVEAECFAFLAVRTLRGLPISFPSTTGAPRPLQGGRIAG
jgi:anhydro-N-acetylmuramic acid kinase